MNPPRWWWLCKTCDALQVDFTDRPAARRSGEAHAEDRGHDVQVGGPAPREFL